MPSDIHVVAVKLEVSHDILGHQHAGIARRPRLQGQSAEIGCTGPLHRCTPLGTPELRLPDHALYCDFPVSTPAPVHSNVATKVVAKMAVVDFLRNFMHT